MLQLEWLPSSESRDRQVLRSVRSCLGNTESEGHHLSSAITSPWPLPWLLWIMGTYMDAFCHLLYRQTLLTPILILNPAVMLYIKSQTLSCANAHAIISVCALALRARSHFCFHCRFGGAEKKKKTFKTGEALLSSFAREKLISRRFPAFVCLTVNFCLG